MEERDHPRDVVGDEPGPRAVSCGTTLTRAGIAWNSRRNIWWITIMSRLSAMTGGVLTREPPEGHWYWHVDGFVLGVENSPGQIPGEGLRHGGPEGRVVTEGDRRSGPLSDPEPLQRSLVAVGVVGVLGDREFVQGALQVAGIAREDHLAAPGPDAGRLAARVWPGVGTRTTEPSPNTSCSPVTAMTDCPVANSGAW